ncbi:MAG: PKD domain-containing protein [Candidatus Poseidoniia archaeon]|nr:PKD domain-containing protein [Candidatus Poseidoniia archaeon]
MTQQRQSLKVLLATAMLLCGAFAGLLLATNASAATYDRDGFVLADGAGLSGATVSAFNSATGAVTNTSTLEDGWYSLDNLEDGDYQFGYEMAGYLAVVNDVTVDGSGSMDDVILVATMGGSGNFTGSVTDGSSPIEGASVTLAGEESGDDWWGGSAAYERSATTDADGNYSFSGLANESFTLRVTAAGYYSSISSSANVVLSVVNDDNLKYVRILDGDGNTLRDAEVMLYEASTATWGAAEKLGGATHVVRPSAASNGNYIFAFHADYATGVTVAGDGAGENLEIVLDTASSGTRVAALPGVPAVTSSIPVMDVSGMTVLLQLNPGPTADIQVTSEASMLAGAYVVAVDEAVSFSAAGASATVGITQLEWDFGEGGASTYGQEELNHSWSAGGSYTVNLTAMDQYGNVDTANVTILVDGSAPTSNFTTTVKASIDDEGTAYNDTNVNEDTSTLVFNGSGSSDGESEIASWVWDFGEEGSDSGSVVSKQFSEPGEYEVTLTTTDAAGNSASDSATIIVNDVTIPDAKFTYYYDINGNGTIEADEQALQKAMEGAPVIFNASSTEDNFDSLADLTFNWVFDDGMSDSGAVVEHVYAELQEGGFNVVLTVTDRAGNEAVFGALVEPATMVRPDLFISSLNFTSDSPQEGDNLVMEATLKLLQENISGSFNVAFYADSIAAGNEFANISVDGANLSAGIEHSYTLTATWSNIPKGEHTIFVVVDAANVIDEGVEKNELVKLVTVKAADDGRDWTSIGLIAAIVMAVFGALGYIYRDQIFGK